MSEITITVRIIFWGLIALAPNPAENEEPWEQNGAGAVAVMVKAPYHVASVILLKGNCDEASADCFRHLDTDPESFADLRPPWSLIWITNKEELSVDASGNRTFWAAPRGKPATDFPRSANPDNEGNLSWVPSIRRLARGAGERVERDCVEDDCDALRSRFLVNRGNLSACHYLHTNGVVEDDIDCYRSAGGAHPRLRAFKFRRYWGGDSVWGYKQTLADAIVVEFSINQDYLDLEWRSIDSSGDGSVSITGDGGEITLLVLNQGPRTEEGEERHRHFRHLYTPARSPVRRPERTIPVCVPELIADIGAGSCEPWLVAYENGGRDLQEKWLDDNDKLLPWMKILRAPHNQAECDMVLFDE